MKTLNFNNDVFEAERILKINTNIIGQEINGNEIFSFKEISDFSQFQLQDENGNIIEFESPPKTIEEINTERILSTENAINAIMTML